MKETCRNHKGAHRLSNRFTSANILLLSYTQAIIKCVATDLHHLHIDYGRSLAITYLFTPKFLWKVKFIESSFKLEYGKSKKKTNSTPSNHESISKIYNAKCAMRPKHWCLFRCTFLTFRMKRAIATMGTVLKTSIGDPVQICTDILKRIFSCRAGYSMLQSLRIK